jgi:DNA polymerase IV
MRTRSIIHLDMDAFYASVEQWDFPELRGLPVVVGGSFERGVVCACSYEARAYGIRSAMAMAKAVRLCPEVQVRPVRMQRYKQVSQEIFAIFHEYTDRVEPLSIDEAFLDVSGCERLFGSPLKIAMQIIDQVRQQTGLTVSAGVAPNKFLAKLASSRCKPAGLLELQPEQVENYLLPLPIECLWGVGQKTSDYLHRFGIKTIGQLRQLERATLEQHLGQAGGLLFELCRGIDSREVVCGETAKSMGAEATFEVDLAEEAELNRELLKLSTTVSRRIRRAGCLGRKLSLKIKYADFSQISRSVTIAAGIDSTQQVYQLAKKLLHDHRPGKRPVRLLGIYLAEMIPVATGQGELFGAKHDKERALDEAIDSLERRFGQGGVTRATVLENDPSANGRKQPR